MASTKQTDDIALQIATKIKADLEGTIELSAAPLIERWSDLAETRKVLILGSIRIILEEALQDIGRAHHYLGCRKGAIGD